MTENSRSQTASARCPFCSPAAIVLRNDLAYARWDGYPVSPGHMLIIPFRHVASFFDASTQERRAFFALLDEAQALLNRERSPDGYNLGLNIGAAAGQTVMHCHLHVIPRYRGDHSDPRGGVRWVLPGKAAYWVDE